MARRRAPDWTKLGPEKRKQVVAAAISAALAPPEPKPAVAPAPPRRPGVLCRFDGRRGSAERESRLSAYWEVSLDPISDDYIPEETDARELFAMWADRARRKYGDGPVPIYWFVDGTNGVGTEYMPFAEQHYPHADPHDFLTWYGWPVVVATGEPLAWPDLPVLDKLWNDTAADKGGFIQQHTGWKPQIYQPFVAWVELDAWRRGRPSA